MQTLVNKTEFRDTALQTGTWGEGELEQALLEFPSQTRTVRITNNDQYEQVAALYTENPDVFKNVVLRVKKGQEDVKSKIVHLLKGSQYFGHHAAKELKEAPNGTWKNELNTTYAKVERDSALQAKRVAAQLARLEERLKRGAVVPVRIQASFLGMTPENAHKLLLLKNKFPKQLAFSIAEEATLETIATKAKAMDLEMDMEMDDFPDLNITDKNVVIEDPSQNALTPTSQNETGATAVITHDKTIIKPNGSLVTGEDLSALFNKPTPEKPVAQPSHLRDTAPNAKSPLRDTVSDEVADHENTLAQLATVVATGPVQKKKSWWKIWK